MKKEREQKYEVYNHRILWKVAELNSQAATSPGKGAKLHALGAMLLYFFAFEGYLNWLGNRIAPEVWEEERKFFSCPLYQGSLGKYRFLAKILRLPSPDASSGPFQTAKGLLKLRDMAVHPKAEAGDTSVKFAEGHFPRHYRGRLAEKVSPKKASRARDHLFELAEDLHRCAKAAYPELIREDNAFGPSLGYSITPMHEKDA
jgi:hypothetical protein